MILFRRIRAGLLLLAGLAFIALAASTGAQGPVQKEKEKEKAPAEVKKTVRLVRGVDWTEEKYSFELDGKEWKYLITWLVDESKLHFVSTYKPPTGSIVFISPKNVKYSLADIFDIINERLIVKE